MRSSPTAACAIELVILARSCTGLKNLLRYARNTVSAPTVIAPARISAAPRQMTIAVQQRDDDVDDGRQQRLHAPRLERRVHLRPARLVHPALLQVLPREGLHDAHRFEPLLDHGHDVALPLPHLVVTPSPIS